MALSLEQAINDRDGRIAELENSIAQNNQLISAKRNDIANIEAAKEEIKNNITICEENITKFISISLVV